MTYLNVVSPLAYDESTGRITGVVDAQGTEHALCNLDESETAALRASGLTSSEATLNAAVQPRSGTLASLVELAGLPGEWAYPMDCPKTAVRFTGVAGGAETWQAGSGWQVFSDSDESHPWCIVSPYATLGDQSFGQTVIGVGIVNDAYRYSVVAIGDSVEVMGSGSVGIGSYSSAYDFGVAIGVAAKALTSSVAIGTNVSSLNENEVCVGVSGGAALLLVTVGGSTTSATPAVLGEVVLPIASNAGVCGVILDLKVTGPNCAAGAWFRRSLMFRTTSGSSGGITLVSSAVLGTDVVESGLSGVSCSVQATSTGFRVVATGLAGTALTWSGQAQVL